MDETKEPEPQEQPNEADDKKAAAAARQAEENKKRLAHEEAEAKRRAEWDAQQLAKKAADKQAVAELAAMSDDAAIDASVERTGAALERLTRRNMKTCVAEHIQALCQADPAFARLTMHPRKSMLHCFWYINRRAREYLEQEMKDNQEKPERGGYGGDVPDGMCYQWAEAYFRDPDAEEDREKDTKFVPKPYNGYTPKPAKKKEPKPEPKKPAKPSVSQPEQLSLFGGAVAAVA